MASGRELLADQRAEPLSRVCAEAGAHLLDNDEGHGGEHHQEQRPVGELSAGAGVGEDAAGVIARVRRDQARPRDSEQREDAPEPPAGPCLRCSDAGHGSGPDATWLRTCSRSRGGRSPSSVSSSAGPSARSSAAALVSLRTEPASPAPRTEKAATEAQS